MENYKEPIASVSVVGESHYKENIAGLGVASRTYFVPVERLYGSYTEGDVLYKYNFDPMPAELVAEPDNPHDANAIRVDIFGETVGYIPRGDTARVRELLSDDPEVEAIITAGPNKLIRDAGGVLDYEQRDYDFSVRLCFYSAENPEPAPTNARIVHAEPESKPSMLARIILAVSAAGLLAATGSLIFMAVADTPLAQYYLYAVAAAVVFGAAAYISVASAVDN